MSELAAKEATATNPLNFDLGKEKEFLRNNIREFVEQECPREYVRGLDEEEEYPEKVWQKLAEYGFLQIPIPEEYGGVSGDVVDMTIVTEELARRSGAIGLTFFMSSCFGAKTLVLGGSEEQKQKYLPLLAEGKIKFAISLTEPDGGTDVAGAMKTRAVQDGDHFVINGQKVWTTAADQSNYLIVFARTNENVQKKVDGISVFLVDRATPGVSTRKLDKIGIRATPSYEVFYDNVRASKENLIGQLDKGMYQMFGMLNNERILTAALCLGEAQAAFEDALAYAKERYAFGKPIGQFQAIQHKLSWMQTKVELARLITYKAAWLQSLGRDCAVEANMAKLVSANHACEVTDMGMQILGGYCYSREYDMQRYWRDCRLHKVGPVSDEMVLNFIGEKLGLPRSY
ncbi:MAG: acyl-CoA/acyl-ACP dehydrogenase [Acidobacteria bacterium]|nr:acyl-CoA/acyl-ACP dehydrogenase [Acidobacteriota bacterium]